jgi:hypothetical protein
VDKVIGDEMWKHFSPDLIDRIEAELAHAKRRRDADRPQREKALKAARREERKAEGRFKYSTPGTPVFTQLEKEWVDAKEEVIRLGALLDSEPAEFSLLTPAEFQELRGLLVEAPTLFKAPTTRNHEKKKIIGLLIARFRKGARTKDVIPGRVIWTTGEQDTSIEIPLTGYTHRVISELLAKGMKYEAIAEKMNELELVTQHLSRWSKHAVGAAARSMRAKSITMEGMSS